MSLRDWPIKQKLTAMLVVISGLVLLLTSAGFAGYQYWSLRQATRDALSLRGRIIAANSTASLAFSNDADARELLSALRADQHIVAAVLYDKDGHVFAAYPGDVASHAVPAAPGPDGYRFEGGLLIGFQPVQEAGSQRLGTLYLASDLEAVYDTFRLSGVIGLAVMAVALLAAYLLSMVLQGTISQPILALAETAKAVSTRQDYSVRASKLGEDELGALIDDLLKLARVTRAEMRTEVVDLSGMARDIAADLQRATPERRVEFVIAPGLTARGDARLLRVALDNLLRNSWKYTAKQPGPRVEFGSVEA